MRCPLLWPLLAFCLLFCVLADQHESKLCKPCKKIGVDGPLAGVYYLKSDSDYRCEDGCSYQKRNNLYCFVPGYEIIEDCEEMAPPSGEEMLPTSEMKPVTFMPPGSEAPPNMDAKCGMKRAEGECIQNGRIVNGQEAGCNEWPWQVGIVTRFGDQVGSIPFCGGTLINENHVITAAHCMPGQTPENTAIVLGDHDLNEQEPAQVAYGVSAIFNHPQYDDFTSQNDITVLRLSSSVDISLYSPACFPSFTSGQSLHGKNGTISGWGALEYFTGDYPDTLQEAQNLIPIVNRDTCVTDTEPWIYEDDILDGMLCAGGPDVGIDTCQGDSGGPLTNEFAENQYQLVGVVSWGRNCAKSYGVYSDVAYYKDWISPITGPLYMAPSS